MPSDRYIIETDKAVLRRKYADTADGLSELKALAAALFSDDPNDVTLTNTAFEGGSASGTVTNQRQLRRIAVEELIAERDPDYVAPQGRTMGRTYRMGFGYPALGI